MVQVPVEQEVFVNIRVVICGPDEGKQKRRSESRCGVGLTKMVESHFAC